MKKEFILYLKSIGIIKEIFERIETIYNFYTKICPDDITPIFVTDYIKEDGSREYENLWFFSDKYCMEAKQFIAKDDFDMDPIKNQIYSWTIKKENYDFERAKEESRIYLTFYLLMCARVSDLKASKQNCDHLRDIFLKYVSPNLKE